MDDVLKKLLVNRIANTLRVDLFKSDVVVSVDLDHIGMTADEVGEALYRNMFNEQVTKIHLVVNGQKVKTKRTTTRILRLPDTLTEAPTFGNIKRVPRTIFKEADPYAALKESAKTCPINWRSLSKDPGLWSNLRIIDDYFEDIVWVKAAPSMPADIPFSLFQRIFKARAFWRSMGHIKPEGLQTFMVPFLQYINRHELEWDGFKYATWEVRGLLVPALGYKEDGFKIDCDFLPNFFWRFPPDFITHNQENLRRIGRHMLLHPPAAKDFINPEWSKWMV